MIITKLFPELGRLANWKMRRKALSVAIEEVSARWQYWAAVAGIVVVSGWFQFSMRRLGIPPDWRHLARWTGVCVTLMACWILLLSFKKTIRRSLWRTLVSQGILCCTSCGYDLTGNTSGVCPECSASAR